MKKEAYIVLILLILILPIVSASWFSDIFGKTTGRVVDASLTCTDSDEGVNYYVMGSAQDNQTTISDMCLATNPKQLSEAYCESESAKSMAYDCPNGCQDGKCVCQTTKCSDGTVYSPEKCTIKNNVCECPSCPISIPRACPAPACKEAKDTGNKDNNGCAIYECPATSVTPTTTPATTPATTTTPATSVTPICQSIKCEDGAVYECKIFNNQCLCPTCSAKSASFYISGISGIKKTYSSSEILNLMIKGVEQDGTPATAEEGFNIQFYIDEWPLVQGQSSRGDNAYYKEGYWYGSISAPDKLAGYRLQISLYCSRQDSYCAKKYGIKGAQADNTYYFSIIKSLCSDSDGLDYYTKGFMKAGENDAGQYDICIAQNDIVEYYCENNEAKKLTYSCSQGCKDGVCLKGEKVSEKVICDFKNTQQGEKCYISEQNSRAYCSGIGSCAADIKGFKGEKVTWKSSCGGYQYTVMDGNDEKIGFDCKIGEAKTEEIKNKGFRNVYFQCYDGAESKSTNREACKSSDYWQKFAMSFCESHCKKYEGVEKCGVNTFSVLNECYTEETLITTPRATPAEIISPAPTESETGAEAAPLKQEPVLICKDSCPLDKKCYPFGYRKSEAYCSDEGKFIEQKTSGICDNNFECSSNVCVDGKCVESGFLQKIMNWFRRLFG